MTVAIDTDGRQSGLLQHSLDKEIKVISATIRKAIARLHCQAIFV